MNVINSYQKEKLIKGKKYWTFYTFTSNSGNSFSEYVKVFQTEVLSKGPRFIFDIENAQTTERFKSKLNTYMNGYGLATCNFYETEEDAKLAHDMYIISFSKSLKGSHKEKILKKIYDNSLIIIEPIEKESIQWYNSLSDKEKTYLKWIKDYYTKI